MMLYAKTGKKTKSQATGSTPITSCASRTPNMSTAASAVRWLRRTNVTKSIYMLGTWAAANLVSTPYYTALDIVYRVTSTSSKMVPAALTAAEVTTIGAERRRNPFLEGLSR